MSTVDSDRDVETILVTEREHWMDGPPHELFRRCAANARALDLRISDFPSKRASGR